jgi:hypothetical protein
LESENRLVIDSPRINIADDIAFKTLHLKVKAQIPEIDILQN